MTAGRPVYLSGLHLFEWIFPQPIIQNFLKYRLLEMAPKPIIQNFLNYRLLEMAPAAPGSTRKRVHGFKHEWLSLYGLHISARDHAPDESDQNTDNLRIMYG